MSVLYLFFKLTKTYENSEQTRYVISLSNGLIAWFSSSYDKPQKVRGDFRFPYGSPLSLPANPFVDWICGFLFFVKIPFVRYLSAILKMLSVGGIKHPAFLFAESRTLRPLLRTLLPVRSGTYGNIRSKSFRNCNVLMLPKQW